MRRRRTLSAASRGPVRPSFACLCLTLWLAEACSGRATVPDRAPSSTRESRPTREPQIRLTADAAYDILPAPEGGLLVWGDADTQSLAWRALGPDGTAQPDVERLPSSGGVIAEVRGKSSGRRVGLSWVVTSEGVSRVYSAVSVDGGRHIGPASPHGQSARASARTGGRLAVAADEHGSVALTYRLSRGPCEVGTCDRYRREVIGKKALGVVRTQEARVVPNACQHMLEGSLYRDGTWYYGVCRRTPRAEHTVFAIRPSLSYAAAFTEAGAGCERAWLAPLDREVAVVSRCADGVQLVTLDRMGRRTLELRDARRRVVCEAGRPVLHIGRGELFRTLHLAKALAQVHPLLPEATADAGARAIWTGETLVVAFAADRQLRMRRFRCVGRRLVETHRQNGVAPRSTGPSPSGFPTSPM